MLASCWLSIVRDLVVDVVVRRKRFVLLMSGSIAINFDFKGGKRIEEELRWNLKAQGLRMGVFKLNGLVVNAIKT